MEEKKKLLAKKWQEVRSVPVAFLGLGFYRAWLTESLASLPSAEAGLLSSKFAFDLTCGLTALLLAVLLAPRIAGKRTGLAAVAAGSMVASSLGLGAGQFLSPLLVTALNVLGAFGMMSLSMLWIEFYASFNPVRMALCYSLALLLGKALAVLLAGYNDAYRLCFQVLLPVVSSWLLLRSRRQVFGAWDDARGASSAFVTSFPWKPALFIGVYAFAYTLSGFSAVPLGGCALEIIGAVPALAVLCSVLFNRGRFDFFSMYGLALPLMVCSFLAVALVPGVSPMVVGACVNVSYSAANILVVLIVCGIAYRTGASALWLFGLVRFVQYVAMAMGLFVRSELDVAISASVVNTAVVPFLVVMLVVVISAVFVTEHSSYFGWNIESIASPAGEKAEVPLVTRVEHVAEEHELTPREQEVLLQLMHRKTVAAIGADMFIAEGTVKAHIQHIYAKLGIHSRKELLGLFE